MNTSASATPSIPTIKDFSYASGERQTATRVEDIRLDHSSRYHLATQILKQHFKDAPGLCGLDAFCGNGYGSWLASRELNAFVLGIDGSADAIRTADQHFSTPRTTFTTKQFPFELPRDAYDFVLCFESIEHVSQPAAFFHAIASSLKPGGVLFVSTPNEASMPFALNAEWFRHHTRHFRREDVWALAELMPGLRFAGEFGQKVYRIADGRVLGVDETADMLPQPNCEDAHFLVHLYLKTNPPAEPAPQFAAPRVEGSDTFTPGVVDGAVLDQADLMLDVGCGEAGPQAGHVGVDIRPLRGIGILSQAWTLEQFLAAGSVSAFYSRHTLEHLTYPQVRNTLASWFRLLRPGGRVHILVPDLLYHIRQFMDPNPQAPSPTNQNWTQRQHALAGFYGWQREADHKLWDVHKSGHTTEIMNELLTESGFIRIRRLENQPWHLDMEAFKPK